MNLCHSVLSLRLPQRNAEAIYIKLRMFRQVKIALSEYKTINVKDLLLSPLFEAFCLLLF